jgi:hypothetical protein
MNDLEIKSFEKSRQEKQLYFDQKLNDPYNTENKPRVGRTKLKWFVKYFILTWQR